MPQSTLRKLVFVASTLIAGLPAQPGMAADTVVSSKALIDTIGVNTHLIYSDGDYNKLPQVLAALRYLGVRHLRDAAPFHGYSNQGYFAKVAMQHYGFCFVFRPNEPLPLKIKALESLERAFPGSVDAVEGLNEINNQKNLTYHSLTDGQAAISFQSDMYDAVRASPVLRRVSVYKFTGASTLPARADYSNYHPYPRGGEQPLAVLSRGLAREQAAMPGKPTVITEAGYHTLVGFPRGWVGVDERTAARLSLTILFDAVQLGIPRVYFYQLLDAYADPTHDKIEKHFGMFDHDFRAKPLAAGIHNLINALRAPGGGPAAASDGGSADAPSIAATDPGVTALKIRRPGGWGVILYRRAPLWDVPNQRAIELAPVNVMVRFAGKRSIVQLSLLSNQPAARTIDQAKTIVPLGSDPVLVMLDRAS